MSTFRAIHEEPKELLLQPTIEVAFQRHLCEDRHTLLEAVHLLQRAGQLGGREGKKEDEE